MAKQDPPSGILGDRLIRTRRRLPHWELGGATYLLTYRCARGRSLDEADRTLVLDNWKHWDRSRYLLHAIVVMPDHVHVLLTPMRRADDSFIPLSELLHTNKGYTAHAVNRRQARSGSVWQDERHDRLVRDVREFWQAWAYLASNPTESGLTSTTEAYAWWYGNAQMPVVPEV